MPHIGLLEDWPKRSDSLRLRDDKPLGSFSRRITSDFDSGISAGLKPRLSGRDVRGSPSPYGFKAPGGADHRWDGVYVPCGDDNGSAAAVNTDSPAQSKKPLHIHCIIVI
jgi:hypothetical protein